jgi:hypothetical protein
VPAPTFTMEFNPNPAEARRGNNQTTAARGTLTFTITNNAAITLTDVEFRHALPIGPRDGLDIPNIANATRFTAASCGANAVLRSTQQGRDQQNNVATPATIDFTRGSIAPGRTCVVEVTVDTQPLGDGLYRYPNSSVTLNNAQAAPVTAGPVTWEVRIAQ